MSISGFGRVKPLEIEDRSVFDSAYFLLEMPLADQCFSMLYIWKDIICLKWAKVNGNVCLFATFEGRNVVWGPIIGGDKLKETIDLCFNYLKGQNGLKDSRICYLPEELAHVYSALPGYSAVHQSQEYLYDSSALCALKGDLYKKKRNMINSFLSSFAPKVELYDERIHKEGCLGLLALWRTQKLSLGVSRKDRFQFDIECEVAKASVKNAALLGLRGMVVKIDGEISAMTFGDLLKPGIANIIIEKTNLNIRGLSDFVFTEFVKRCWSDCSLVNVQEDMGVEYLRQAKLSYNPCRVLKSFSVVRDGTN